MSRGALLASLTLVLTGCTDGDSRMTHEEYEQQLRAAIVEAQSAVLKNGGAISRAPVPIPDDPRVELLVQRIDGAAAKVEALEPPEDAGRWNREIASALRAIADSASSLAAKPQAGFRPLSGYQDALLASPGEQRLRAAVRELADLGYTLE